MSTIGFIGLGHMGGPMAANLVKAGHKVVGFDLAPAALEQAVKDGASVADSAVDAVRGADVVITMLPSGKHVLGLYEELLPVATPARCSSTVPPSTSPTPARRTTRPKQPVTAASTHRSPVESSELPQARWHSWSAVPRLTSKPRHRCWT